MPSMFDTIPGQIWPRTTLGTTMERRLLSRQVLWDHATPSLSCLWEMFQDHRRWFFNHFHWGWIWVIWVQIVMISNRYHLYPYMELRTFALSCQIETFQILLGSSEVKHVKTVALGYESHCPGISSFQLLHQAAPAAVQRLPTESGAHQRPLGIWTALVLGSWGVFSDELFEMLTEELSYIYSSRNENKIIRLYI